MISKFAICLLLPGFISSADTALKRGDKKPFLFTADQIETGKQFMNDEADVYFSFVNRSGRDIVIGDIVSQNESNITPWSPIRTLWGEVIKKNQRDSIGFARVARPGFVEGRYDNTWLISFDGTEVTQEIHITGGLQFNKGKLVVEPAIVKTVNRGEQATFTANVKNEGISPVTINPFKTSTIEHISTYPLTIQPGQAQELGFSVETAYLLNEYDGIIFLKTNQEEPAATLVIDYSGTLISKDHPSIKFDSTRLTIEAAQNAEVVFHFWFTNNGDLPLVIEKAEVTCGCVMPVIPTEPIAPGERGEIKVKYDSSRTGPINKTINIRTNASMSPIILQVKGNIQ